MGDLIYEREKVLFEEHFHSYILGIVFLMNKICRVRSHFSFLGNVSLFRTFFELPFWSFGVG